MDPNALLETLRALAAKMIADGEKDGIDTDDAAELAEGFANLDTWLTRGGFSPWQGAS